MLSMIKSQVLKIYKTLSYLPLLGLAMTLTMGRLLIYAQMLDVEQFGVLNLYLITSTIYLATSCFGLYVDLQRKMPVELNNGSIEFAIGRIILTCQGALLVATLSIAGAVIFWLYKPVQICFILIGVIYGFAQQLFLISITESRSAMETMRYSKQSLTRAVLIILIAVPMAKYFGSALTIVLVETLISVTISIMIFRRIFIRYGISARELFIVSTKLAKQIEWRSLCFIFIIMMSLALSLNLDRWIAAQYLNIVDFSIYSFAAIIMTVAYQGQAMINAAVYPVVAIRFSISSRSAFKMTFLVSIGTCALAIVGCLIAVPAISWGIEVYYSVYLQSVPLILPLAIAAAFRVSDYWTNFLIIAGAETLALLIGFFSTVLPLLFWVIYGTTTPIGISYLVLTLSVSNFFFSILGVIYLHVHSLAR